MKIYKCILVCVFSLLMSACVVGGILTDGGGGGGDTPTVTATVFPGDDLVAVTWDSTNADNFRVTRDDVEGVFDGDGVGFVDTNVDNGTRYCYQVAAENTVAALSVLSTTVCATPMAGAVLTVTDLSLSGLFTWDPVDGAVSYNLYLDGSFPGPFPNLSKGMNKADGDDEDVLIANVVGTSYTWTGLSNNCVTYPVKVVPVDIDGNESEAETVIKYLEPDTEGILDASFGTDGVANAGGANGTFYGVAIMEDDTIVGVLDGDNSILIGYDDAGDTLWDISFEATMDTVRGMAVDSEERVLVAGSDSGNAKVCRFIPSGDVYVLDTAGFGTGGCYQEVTPATHANAIALDSQDRIVLAGQTGVPQQITVWRVNSDGSGLDGSFAINGSAFSLALDNWSYASGVTVTTATTLTGSEERAFITIVKQDGGGIDGGYYLQLTDAGTIGGFLDITPMSGGVTGVVRLPNDHLLTTMYDTATAGAYMQEISITPIKNHGLFPYFLGGTNEVANGVSLDCHDRAVVTGRATAGAEMMVFRTDEVFALDADFASSGQFIYPSPNPWGGNGFVIAFDSRGRIIVAGRISTFLSTQPVLLRIQ